MGHNTLKENNAIINYNNNTLILNGKKFKINYEGQPETDELDNLHELFNIEVLGTQCPLRTEHLNSEERDAIQILIQNNNDVFYKKGDDLTFTNEVKHRIDTGLSGPIYTKTYRYPTIHTAEVERQMTEMLDQGIIRHSSSPYNAPILVVPKKEDKSGNKEWRIVIDYRKLNMATKEDKYPIPRIDDILDKLGRANYFSTLDLTKGFYQIEVEPEDREKTAFTTHNGHYEFIRMPFGLKNAPATFQRMMNNVLREHVNKICVIYMDDILVFSTSLQEHLINLEKIFKTLREANLKVSLNKSDFLRKETEFLGHIVTKDGIKPNPNKVDGIKKQTIPKTVREIQSFLGLSGYYRKFIPDYAKIAKPMTLRLKKDSKINVNDEDYKQSFEKLKTILMSDMVLRYPDLEEQFQLTTDASNYALGAVLSQSKGPIAFASRTLNQHEINYSTVEKELLAIVWAVKQFRHYLYGRKFKLRTDHKPLVWLANLKEPNSKLIRWKIKLNEYEFDIQHVQGKDNKVADALSRLREINVFEGKPSRFECSVCGKIYTHKQSLTLHMKMHTDDNLQCKICGKRLSRPRCLRDHLRKMHNHVEREETFENIRRRSESPVPTVHSADEDSSDHFLMSQRPLHSFNYQIVIKHNNENKTERSLIFGKSRVTYSYADYTEQIIAQILSESGNQQDIGMYCENTDDLIKIQNEYKKLRENPNNPFNIKIMLTNQLRENVEYENLLEIIAKHHRFENNHPGIEKTYMELKGKIYYPNLKKEITKFINNCLICNFKLERNPIKLPFEKTDTPRAPHEHYHTDIWYLDRSTTYVTMIDKFSKYAMIEEVQDRTPLQLIKSYIKLFMYMKTPKNLTLDNETSFRSALFTDFLDKKGINYHFVTPNRHTGNSDIERFHATLNENIRIFKKREENLDIAYNVDLPYQALEAYNNSTHMTTGEKPINLHFRNNIVLKEIFDRIEEKKNKTLEYRNKDRKDESINEGVMKTHQTDKLTSKMKQVTVEKINDKKYKRKKQILHKDQFIKRKNISRSLEVLVDNPDDDNTGNITEIDDN